MNMKMPESTSPQINRDIELLLCGYADYGLTEFIYPEYLEHKDEIGTDCILRLAEHLAECGIKDNEYTVQSIRMASARLFNSSQEPSKELFKLAFPRPFESEISKNCRNYNLSEYLLYGLIRSESFFNAEVNSRAGAVGLTQLMPETAKDVAGKLKLKDYDIEDSATNIKFGTFYIEELKRRLDDSEIMALFAYNGGISRIRRWEKITKQQLKRNDVPHDILLESLPYSETREYGRKVSSAAAIYGWLYYKKCACDVIEEIMN